MGLIGREKSNRRCKTKDIDKSSSNIAAVNNFLFFYKNGITNLNTYQPISNYDISILLRKRFIGLFKILLLKKVGSSHWLIIAKYRFYYKSKQKSVCLESYIDTECKNTGKIKNKIINNMLTDKKFWSRKKKGTEIDNERRLRMIELLNDGKYKIERKNKEKFIF
ncbi:hypothetical protein [uncultured Flavobacterium sp.]|uniref:hypothetical protein n=1 Tax=uncultured Flavobacterium sp. TaxID=165435 RepID=UPI002598A160|nr:hypothetical protein [uncultured Flavobacterium sp.]